MSPNRVVALLTPLVFAPLAGAIAAWIAKHFPGASVRGEDLQEIFIGGALIALAPAAQWLHGWQRHEERQAEAELAVALAGATASAGAPAHAAGPEASGELALDPPGDEELELDAAFGNGPPVGLADDDPLLLDAHEDAGFADGDPDAGLLDGNEDPVLLDGDEDFLPVDDDEEFEPLPGEPRDEEPALTRGSD